MGANWKFARLAITNIDNIACQGADVKGLSKNSLTALVVSLTVIASLKKLKIRHWNDK